MRDHPDEEWAAVTAPQFVPGSVQALRTLQERGYAIVVVTNQYTIGEGIISERQYSGFTDLVLAGLRAGGVEPVAVLHAFVVGDSSADMQLAVNLGIPGICPGAPASTIRW